MVAGGGDVLVITDGQVMGTEDIIAKARSLGVRIHCLGIGSASQDRFLECNLTTETLHFDKIDGPIPNRGLLMHDINMFGLRYLQQISQTSDNTGLHIEPGLWVNIPSTRGFSTRTKVP